MSAAASVPRAAPLRVVIADDQPHARLLLRRAIGSSPGIVVVGEAANGEQALALVNEHDPDLLLLDLDMPVLDGTGVLRALRAFGRRAAVLVLTGNADGDSVAAAIEAGADGYVLKGCSAEELRAAIRDVGAGASVLTPTVARNVLDDYMRLVEERRQRDIAVIQTLASAVEARDEGTGNHCQNVARYGLELWREVTGVEPDDDLVYGFLLHDIGKISIPDAILLKPGALTDEEVAIMRRHVEIGVELVEPLGFRSQVVEIIRCHHERVDGAGYPRGLRGEEIPLAARVFSIVDAFDAMVADRPYRRGMTAEEATDELRRCAGTQFDADAVGAFVRIAERGL